MISLGELIKRLPEGPVISIAGAGGKTTLMFRLAEMLPVPCVMTTTTKVGADQIRNADSAATIDCIDGMIPAKKMWVSPSLEPVKGKIPGCTLADFKHLAGICAKRSWGLVNEADGAACRHIKAPSAHEPVIPAESNVCVYAVGLDVLGKSVSDATVHRPEVFTRLTGTEAGEAITAEAVLRLLEHPEGGLKGFPAGALRVVYLTHADTSERKDAAAWINDRIKTYDFVCAHE